MAAIRNSLKLVSQSSTLLKCWQTNTHCLTKDCLNAWIPSTSLLSKRNLSLSPTVKGMEEFFDTPERINNREVKSGASWSKSLLRKKSIEDLHKLWFILLKERNMLNTLEHYCIEEDEPIPGEDRIEKVAESMSNLRDVIEEREHAKNMLLHGTPDNKQSEWRKSALGTTYLYRYREHFIPEELQLIKKRDKHADMAYFQGRLEEMHLRMEETRIKKRDQYYYRIRMKYAALRRNNPKLPVKVPKWYMDKFKTTWKYGIHPMLPILDRPRDNRFYKAKAPRPPPS